MHEYRVTKYDPKLRDLAGAYLVDDWTSYSDVGKDFGGAILTLGDYLVVENSYLDSAISFLEESGYGQLQVTDLENPWKVELEFKDGGLLDGTSLRKALKLVLREAVWARFSDSCGRFIHFGYDFYMYVGVTKACKGALDLARERGLFVESYSSPYRNLND